MSLVAIGNWLFHTRNFLFPLAVEPAMLPGPTLFPCPIQGVAVGFSIAVLGQVIRVGTIGFKYIIRGGRNRRLYAETW